MNPSFSEITVIDKKYNERGTTNYEVNFSTSKDFPLLNRITSVNDLLSQFIGDHYKASETNRLLTGVKMVLNNELTNYESYTQSMQITVVNNSLAKIYGDMDAYEDNNNLAADFSLPASDFKVILEAWRDYLVASPLKLGQ